MPVALAEICVLAASKPGGLVFDPFAGTGTTGVAALKRGRKFIGIELVERFVNPARARLLQVAQPTDLGTPVGVPAAPGNSSR